MEEENERLGTDDSNTVVEGADGHFAIGNVRIMRPIPQQQNGQSYVTYGEENVLTKRGTESSARQLGDGVSYAMNGMEGYMDNNFNLEGVRKTSFVK